MIKIAEYKDVTEIAKMMRELYQELQPAHATSDINVYFKDALDSLIKDTDTTYIEKGKGFFTVRNETEPMTPTLERYNGIRVYIYPEHRNSSLLARFYDRLFKDFPNGEILGVTEINSEHIRVLDKRHTLIAKMYRLKRRSV